MEPVTSTSAMQRISQSVLVLILVAGSMNLLADALAERRALVGLNLFRTFVAADRDLQRHRNQYGYLPVVVLYARSPDVAERFQEQLLQSFSSVKEIPTDIQSLSLEDLLTLSQPPGAVFVAEKLTAGDRQRLVLASIQRQFLVFSPFEGDVEAGVLGGLAVEARVTPVVNMNTLTASRIPLKQFYLSVSRRYAE